MTHSEVEAMIAAALAPVYALLAECVAYGAGVALQAHGEESGPGAREGKYLCAEDGGPTQEGAPFRLTGRSEVAPWETWTVTRGV